MDELNTKIEEQCVHGSGMHRSGEVILGHEITERRVHSVNSLVSKTGINRFRLYRLMRKTGLIPETADEAAFNQWVFPAEDGERLIARILNSVPQNKVQHVLGCSKTHAEQLSLHGLITSIVPISEGQVGQTQGYFNHNDLDDFRAFVHRRDPAGISTVNCPEPGCLTGFTDLTTCGSTSRSSVILWSGTGNPGFIALLQLQ